MPSLRRSPKVTLALLALVLLVQLSPHWVPTRDGAAYISIARSVTSGTALSRFGEPHLYFAPGYPVFIAPVFLYSDRPFLVISFVHWLLLLLFIGATFIWLKRLLPDHALWLTVLCGANVGVLYYFRRTLSEAVFMPVLIGAAVAMDAAIDAGNDARRLKYAILSALLVGYLCTVRAVGMTLACGFALLVLYKATKRELAVARAAFYIVAVAGMALSATLLVFSYDRAMALANHHAPTYFEQFNASSLGLFQQLFFTLRLRIQEIGRLLVPGAFRVYGGWLNPIMAIYIPAFIVVVIGWFKMLQRRPSTLLLTFPFYFSLYLVWPYDQGARFMTPMVPVLWLSLIGAILLSKWRSYISRFSSWLVLGTFITSMVYLVADKREAKKSDRYWALAESISQVAPGHAQLAVMRTSSSFSVSAFAAMCSVKRDRRCQELRDDAPQPLPHPLEYIVVLGPAQITPGFTPILKTDSMTVLHRPETPESDDAGSSNRSDL